MSIDDIISAVRFCIDEEATNGASFANAASGDDTRMNNIIKNKIGDALRWVCLYAPAELLGGSDESVSTGILVDESPTPTAAYDNKAGKITLSENFIKLSRVRVSDWHRAVKTPLLEDSDEYLQVHDTNGAEATVDRPQASLMNTKTKKVEVWPGTGTFTLTYIKALSTSDLGNLNNDSTEVGIPTQVETSFIYYLAYLLLTAYGDARAKSMFDVATLNLGRTEDKQRQ